MHRSALSLALAFSLVALPVLASVPLTSPEDWQPAAEAKAIVLAVAKARTVTTKGTDRFARVTYDVVETIEGSGLGSTVVVESRCSNLPIPDPMQQNFGQHCNGGDPWMDGYDDSGKPRAAFALYLREESKSDADGAKVWIPVHVIDGPHGTAAPASAIARLAKVKAALAKVAGSASVAPSASSVPSVVPPPVTASATTSSAPTSAAPPSAPPPAKACGCRMIGGERGPDVGLGAGLLLAFALLVARRRRERK